MITIGMRTGHCLPKRKYMSAIIREGTTFLRICEEEEDGEISIHALGIVKA